METRPPISLSTGSSENDPDNEHLGLSRTTFQTFSNEQLCDVLIQKEYQLECARDMVQSLSVFESECQRKDGVIRELRKELSAYRRNSHSKDVSYVTMEEHLAACENHLQVRTKEAESLNKQVKALNEKVVATEAKLVQLSIPSHQITALQVELSSKTSTILRQNEELMAFKKKQETDEESIAALRHSVVEKQANVASLQASSKKLKSMNQDLRKRLEMSQSENQKLSAGERKHKADLGKLKNTASAGRLAQAKQDFLEAKVTKTKTNENNLATQLVKVKEEMSATCQSVLSVIAGVIPPTDSTGCCDPSTTIVCVVEKLTQEYARVRELEETTHNQLQEVQKDCACLQEASRDLEQLWTKLKDELENVNSSGDPEADADIESTLTVFLTGLKDLSSEQEYSLKTMIVVMEESLSHVTTYLSVHLAKWRELVGDIERKCENLESLSADPGTKDPGKKVSVMSDLIHSLNEECTRLKERISEAEDQHSRAISDLKRNEEDRLTKSLEESLAKEKEESMKQIQELEEKLELDKQQAISEQQLQNSAINEELGSTKEILLTERDEKNILIAEKARLEAKLLALEVTMSETLVTAEEQKEKLKSQLTEEMYGYKEQSHQHALTIVALEDKLIRLIETCKQLKSENEVLTQENCHSENGSIGNNDNDQVEKLHKLTDTLRRQLSIASEESCKSKVRVKQLECDLQTIRNQIQNREVALTRQHSEEVGDLNLTLSRQESTIEGQRAEIDQLKSVLQEKSKLLASSVTEKIRAGQETTEVKKALETLRKSSSDSESSIKMIQLGQRCFGEKHGDVISNQREAITQLRRQINELELAKPPVGSHQATLKELSRVRHELLKAQSKPTELVTGSLPSKEGELPSLSSQVLGKEDKTLTATIAELNDSLHCSERTYKYLVDIICKCLVVLEKPVALNLALENDHSKKKEILMQRKKFADDVRLHMKTQFSQDKQQGESDPMIELRSEVSPEDKIASLQSLLHSTAEELEQQRRLNQALFKRSAFKESQFAESTRRPHHNCL